MTARRVDLSRTGDSILTDIIDGVAHSLLVLADVSIVGYDSKGAGPYRNGNVMYEVGLALACRHPSEVLLIRDDQEKFLFDVSTVPHKHIDFGTNTARDSLTEALHDRLHEIDHLADARLAMAVASLTSEECQILSLFSAYGPDRTFWIKKTSPFTHAGLGRLLDKQIIKTVKITDDGKAMFTWTELGFVLAKNLNRFVPVHQTAKVETATVTDAPPEPSAAPPDED